MANELRFDLSGSLTNGNLSGNFRATFNADQTTAGWMQFQRTVTQAAEIDITFADITTNGWLFIRNLDATNYVKWGPKSGTMVEMGRIYPGKTAGPFFVAPGVVLRMVANVADCKCQFTHSNA